VEPLLGTEAARYSGAVPPPCTEAAVQHYIDQEWAEHLSDVMVRRGGWHYYRHEADQDAEKVADWMAQHAGWSVERRSQELAAYRAGIHAGVSLPPVS
jgi:glycerol-3-phosphate dehydrogenase